MKNRNLDNLNIYALRLYARKFGVKAPTSKKKKDLIQEIVKIQNGEKLCLPGSTPWQNGDFS